MIVILLQVGIVEFFVQFINLFLFSDVSIKEIELFEGMIKSDPGQYSNKEMVNLVNNYLSRIFNISEENLPQPYAVGK